jgi:hypothetical protein
VRFVEDFFPLLFAVSPEDGYDENVIRVMSAGYERFWARGDRYALISLSSSRGSVVNARGRRLITDWANSPRVRAMSKEFCVGSATIVTSALARGALTAILWLWTPATPHEAVSTPEEAVDFCLKKLAQAGVKLPRSAEVLREEALASLRTI